MKKKMLFLPLMAALMFSACSQDEDNTGTNGSGGDSKTNYLTVNLVSASNMGTRATNPGNNDFAEGTKEENAVKTVRFYFFDNQDKAANVKKKGGVDVNYYDWTVDGTADGNMPNVEKKLSTTLIIQSPAGDKLPATVVAVLNPTREVEEATVGSLTDLNTIAKNFGLTTESFVMSNSVYAQGGEKVEAVSVSGHIYPEPEAAKKNPVVIYVERVLAKVRLGVSNELESSQATIDGKETTIYKTGVKSGENFESDQDIYVRFLGWNVTATVDKSHLMKSINSKWLDDLFGIEEPWNFPEYFRSFWAINPTGLTYNYGSFNKQGDEAKAQLKGFTDTDNYTYVQENAAPDNSGANATTPTQVIIAAQLVDVNGKALEIAEMAGIKYPVSELKELFANSANLWKDGKVEDENGDLVDGRIKIEPSDIEFMTATAAAGATEPDKTKPGRYYVFATLSATVAEKKWYADDNVGTKEDPESASKPIGTDGANKVLQDLGHAKIWKTGLTYYYFDIKHLGADGKSGQYGVVRNHLYNATITKLAGLGTPVYNPDETIYPEKPGKDDQYIAAQINILSWRLVPSNVELEW